MPQSNGSGPSMNFLQRYFGPSFMAKKRKEDVKLPMPSGGRKDPRLRTTADDVQEGIGVMRGLMKKYGKK